MASSDSLPQPKKNVAYRVIFPIFDADGDLVAGASSLDSEISQDCGTFTDCTNEATEIATSSGMYYLDLTSTEMNADSVAVIVKTATSGAKTAPIILYPEEAGDIRADVTMISGDATAADNLELAADGTGYNLGAGSIVAASVTAEVSANVTKISSDATAADNAEAFFDGTGYAGTNNVMPNVTTVTGGVTVDTFTAGAKLNLKTANTLNGTYISVSSPTTTTTSVSIPDEYTYDDILIGCRLVHENAAGAFLQARNIVGWNNTTQVITVDEAWAVVPTDTDVLFIYPNTTTSTSVASIESIKSAIEELLSTSTRAELSGVPSANASLAEKLTWLAMLARNKRTQDASEEVVFADNASTAIATSAKTKLGEVFTRGEFEDAV